MIDVVVLGQPYWGTRIAQALDGQGGDMRARFVAQRDYLAFLARPPGAHDVVLIRAGYRVGATKPRGRLFDAYWAALTKAMPSAVRCHYWLGTDVADTTADAAAGSLRRGAVEAARADLHLADAPWLADELGLQGITAHTAHVPQDYACPDPPPAMPGRFRVLTYAPGNRFAFYGGDLVTFAARALPDVAFDVVGDQGSRVPERLPNVTYHGWVSDMGARYAEASVVVRVPQHDGTGATVIEGLLHARHVIYNHDLPYVERLVPETGPALAEALGRLRDAASAGRLAPNLEGREFAGATFNKDALTTHLATLLRSRL